MLWFLLYIFSPALIEEMKGRNLVFKHKLEPSHLKGDSENRYMLHLYSPPPTQLYTLTKMLKESKSLILFQTWAFGCRGHVLWFGNIDLISLNVTLGHLQLQCRSAASREQIQPFLSATDHLIEETFKTTSRWRQMLGFEVISTLPLSTVSSSWQRATFILGTSYSGLICTWCSLNEDRGRQRRGTRQISWHDVAGKPPSN